MGDFRSGASMIYGGVSDEGSGMRRSNSQWPLWDLGDERICDELLGIFTALVMMTLVVMIGAFGVSC